MMGILCDGLRHALLDHDITYSMRRYGQCVDSISGHGCLFMTLLKLG